MIKSKLHNPVIAKNSHIENAVIEKVNNITESTFMDFGSTTPVVPETGRIWFNTDKGQFSFANIGLGGNGANYVDEFLSRTDLRAQEIVSTVDFQNTVKINALDDSNIVTIDSSNKKISVDGSSLNVGLSGDSNSVIGGKQDTTIGGEQNTTVTGAVTETYKSTLNVDVAGAATETYKSTLNVDVLGDVTENYSSSQQTNITKDLGLKVGSTITVADGLENVKIKADHSANSLTINYAKINISGQVETHTISDKFVVNSGIVDKFILDNTADKFSVNYTDAEFVTARINSSVSDKLTLTDGVNEKIVANNKDNTLSVNYAETTITGNTTVDGNVLITGDLTVGGQTTKVDVASENLRIADNVIVLNSNLDETVDPRLASAIVDGTDVDHDAGVSVNRGSQGYVDLIKWVESTDTSSLSTLNEAVAKTSIFNYEAATPAYELSQIIDAYTLGRQVKDKSGSSWVGYDGYEGKNYKDAIAAGEGSAQALDYSFKLDAGSLDNTVDSIVQEIDDIKFAIKNINRVGETPSMGTIFTITHNLGTVFVNVSIQRLEGDGNWYFDVVPVQVMDPNTVKIVTSEPTKIRYMITAIEGFDVNQATEMNII